MNLVWWMVLNCGLTGMKVRRGESEHSGQCDLCGVQLTDLFGWVDHKMTESRGQAWLGAEMECGYGVYWVIKMGAGHV